MDSKSPLVSDHSGTPLATISGTVPYADAAALVFQRPDGSISECPVRDDSSFSAQVSPGRYHIFLKTAAGALQLVKTSVLVEEYLTVNFLEVQMVPVPAIISVAVPVIYDDSAIIEWETDIESEGRVDYGMDQTYGFSTHTTTDLKKQHRLQIHGLNPATPYFFRIVAGRHGMDDVRNFSREFSFVTTSTVESRLGSAP
jgi:hypothetical protein